LAPPGGRYPSRRQSAFQKTEEVWRRDPVFGGRDQLYIPSLAQAPDFDPLAASVPDDFRFAAKLPKKISHELRLVGTDDVLCSFLEEIHFRAASDR
jgi:hypothetical protein